MRGARAEVQLNSGVLSVDCQRRCAKIWSLGASSQATDFQVAFTNLPYWGGVDGLYCCQSGAAINLRLNAAGTERGCN